MPQRQCSLTLERKVCYKNVRGKSRRREGKQWGEGKVLHSSCLSLSVSFSFPSLSLWFYPFVFVALFFSSFLSRAYVFHQFGLNCCCSSWEPVPRASSPLGTNV